MDQFLKRLAPPCVELRVVYEAGPAALSSAGICAPKAFRQQVADSATGHEPPLQRETTSRIRIHPAAIGDDSPGSI
ncbi:MAG TPA: hypothetical protein DCY13_03480 [Verrucomicrobiales bacterium]|nr:hypothetical protein [Verrucomicrobiales bacterium]